MSFSTRLRELREQAGLSQVELAAAVGISKTGLANLEQGKSKPAWETVRSIAKALNTTCQAFDVDEAVETAKPRIGRPPITTPAAAKPDILAPDREPVLLPFTGPCPCGRPKYIGTGAVDDFPTVPIPRKKGIRADAGLFVVRAEGGSMADAGINDGDMVVIRPNPSPDLGTNVMAILGDGEATIKRFAHNKENGARSLISCDGSGAWILESEIRSFAGEVVDWFPGIDAPDSSRSLGKRK